MSPEGSMTFDRPHVCDYFRLGCRLKWITLASLPRNKFVASRPGSARSPGMPYRYESFYQLHRGIATPESTGSVPAGADGSTCDQQIGPDLLAAKTLTGPGAAGAASTKFFVVSEDT
jgi:hypothetical protein